MIQERSIKFNGTYRPLSEPLVAFWNFLTETWTLRAFPYQSTARTGLLGSFAFWKNFSGLCLLLLVSKDLLNGWVPQPNTKPLDLSIISGMYIGITAPAVQLEYTSSLLLVFSSSRMHFTSLGVAKLKTSHAFFISSISLTVPKKRFLSPVPSLTNNYFYVRSTVAVQSFVGDNV